MDKILLMGATEIARRLGVGRQRAHAITRDRDFPEPYQKLAMGSVWSAADVEQWIKEHRPALAEDPEDA
jgi:prophage regulatory protein